MTDAMQNLNLDKIRNSVAEHPRYKAIFEIYLERHRGRQDSTPSRMRRVLRETGKGDYPLSELTQFYQDMQAAGAGRWISARNGKEGRFMWDFHLVTLAEAVLNRRSKTFIPRNEEKKPLPKGTILPAPTARKTLPKVVVMAHEDRPRAATTYTPAPTTTTRPLARVDDGAGGYIDVPPGMNAEEMKDFWNFVKMAREINKMK